MRPEAVDLFALEPAGSVNRVRGRLAGVAHLGDVVQRVVVTASGLELIARSARGTVGETLDVGTDVWCTFGPDDVHVFPS